MRILLASSSSGSHGGGEIFLRYLGEALHADGHEVALWASEHDRMDDLAQGFAEFGEVIRSPYRNTYDLRARSLGASMHNANRRAAATGWATWQPDIVHINKQNLEDGLDLLNAARDGAIPHLCTIHITQSARYLRANNAWLRDTLSRCALTRYPGLITAVSDRRQQELQSFAGLNGTVRRIYNGIPDVDPVQIPEWRTRCRADLGIDDDQMLITMVARMTAQKSPQHFLDAALKIGRRLPQARFLWVGDGDFSTQWDRWVEDNDMADRITRLGWQADTRPWFAASDRYLHLAQYEGLPLAILEAMRMGLPCFITQSMVDEVEVFRDSPLQVAHSNGSEDWIGNIEAAGALVAPTRRLYEKHFRAEVMAGEFSNIYREAIAQQRA